MQTPARPDFEMTRIMSDSTPYSHPGPCLPEGADHRRNDLRIFHQIHGQVHHLERFDRSHGHWKTLLSEFRGIPGELVIPQGYAYFSRLIASHAGEGPGWQP